MLRTKSDIIFLKLAKEYYNPSTSDKHFNYEVSKSRATALLKKKFDLTGRIANDSKITGGVYRNKINNLGKSDAE